MSRSEVIHVAIFEIEISRVRVTQKYRSQVTFKRQEKKHYMNNTRVPCFLSNEYNKYLYSIFFLY